MGIIANFIEISEDRLQKWENDPEGFIDFIMEHGDVPEIDLDKAWHGIHYMLAGSAEATGEPLSLVIFGGEPFGEALDYGPARVLSTPLVQQLSVLLGELGEQEFASRYAPEKMAEADIYPNVWVSDGDDALDYLLSYYRQLVTFFEGAAKRNNAIITWLG